MKSAKKLEEVNVLRLLSSKKWLVIKCEQGFIPITKKNSVCLIAEDGEDVTFVRDAKHVYLPTFELNATASTVEKSIKKLRKKLRGLKKKLKLKNQKLKFKKHLQLI